MSESDVRGPGCPADPTAQGCVGVAPRTLLAGRLCTELRPTPCPHLTFTGTHHRSFKLHRVWDIFISFKELDRNLIIIFIFFLSEK